MMTGWMSSSGRVGIEKNFEADMGKGDIDWWAASLHSTRPDEL